MPKDTHFSHEWHLMFRITRGVYEESTFPVYCISQKKLFHSARLCLSFPHPTSARGGFTFGILMYIFQFAEGRFVGSIWVGGEEEDERGDMGAKTTSWRVKLQHKAIDMDTGGKATSWRVNLQHKAMDMDMDMVGQGHLLEGQTVGMGSGILDVSSKQ